MTFDELVAAITPSLEAVASHIWVRTRDEDGVEQGTFNEATIPTGDAAQGYAERAARHVAVRLGQVADDSPLIEPATDCAAVYAALQIETALSDSEEAASTDQLGRMFREQIDALVAANEHNVPGGRRLHSIRQRTAANTQT